MGRSVRQWSNAGRTWVGGQPPTVPQERLAGKANWVGGWKGAGAMRPGKARIRYTIDWTPVRHVTAMPGSVAHFRLNPPSFLSREDIAHALAMAVSQLRGIDTALGWATGRSQGPFNDTNAAAISAAVMSRCREVRAATDGYFDPWALPGGFDPSGMLTGWALEQAGATLLKAGISDFSIEARGKLLLRGNAPGGDGWRVCIHDPDYPTEILSSLHITNTGLATEASEVIDPYTQRPKSHFRLVTVMGPDLATADGYATALRAAGPAGLSWFPTSDGYEAVLYVQPHPGGQDISSAA